MGQERPISPHRGRATQRTSRPSSPASWLTCSIRHGPTRTHPTGRYSRKCRRYPPGTRHLRIPHRSEDHRHPRRWTIGVLGQPLSPTRRRDDSGCPQTPILAPRRPGGVTAATAKWGHFSHEDLDYRGCMRDVVVLSTRCPMRVLWWPGRCGKSALPGTGCCCGVRTTALVATNTDLADVDTTSSPGAARPGPQTTRSVFSGSYCRRHADGATANVRKR